MKTCLLLLAALLLLSPPAPAATQVDLPGPPGSGQFGSSVTVLPNGNFVVTDPSFDQVSPAVADIGAVYLYNPDGLLISTLRGGNANDQVGSSGITVLANGNFAVRSPNWNGARGAVTWGSAVSGFIGGASVTVSAANSLVGSTAIDLVGVNSITALTNGHYVVRSPDWDNGPATDAGAATWGDGFTGIVGAVSAANSLVGTTANDQVGNAGVTALTNGHYVVRSINWDNGPTTDVGAVTWGNGNGGTTGAVSAANSLHGTTAFDQVGSNSVTALTNGHYVVSSPIWNNGPTVDVGAVTWVDGFTGITGPVTTANSLHGSTASDIVGNGGVTALTNGHYVVRSGSWDNSPTTNVGAVTWGNGFTGITGFVSAANSLVGTTAGDAVGSSNVIALSNGHYVVSSTVWDNGPTTNAGAVTWGNGFTGGTTGPVTTTNSLHGSTTSDQVGSGVTALTNGHYVVTSPNWDNGPTTNAGAVTWGNGFTGGTTGPVTTTNSLHGSTTSDQVGSGVTALTNGHYVVTSPNWDNGPTTNAGAATRGNGTTGTKGPVTPANSLHGSTASDQVGNGVIALTNGHYVVRSPLWNNGPTADVGAVTWGNGATGITGPVTPANSLHGSTANDQTSVGGNSALSDGNALIRSSNWDNGVTSFAGAVSFINGQTGTAGPITAANSVLGTVVNGGINITFDYDPARKQMIVGRRDSNLVTLFRADRLRSLAVSGHSAPGAADIAFGKPGTTAVSPDGSALSDFTLSGSGSSKGKNRALFSLNPVTGTDLVLQSGTPLSALGGGLPFNATATALTGQIFNQPSRALFQATVKGTGISATNNRLLLLDNGASVQLLHRSGTPIPALGGAAIASFKEVLQSHDQNFLALTYKLKTGGGVTPANDEGLLFLDHSGSPGSNTLAAREGFPAFGGGTFGPFNGRAASAFGSTIYFTAALNIAGSTAPAVFSTTLNGVTTARLATTGDLAPASGGATYRTFPALINAGVNTLVKATLKNSPASENEGLYVLPTNLMLTRKGDDIGGGTFITRILRFWTAGPGQLILHVQLGKSQALLLRQNDGNYLTLLRTGTSAPGVGSAKLKAISAVEVNPVSGRYAVLGTLSGSPANSNQALWTGDPTLGDNTPPALQDLRLPQLTLRKGNTYTTDATPQSVIRSIALKPAVDPTGAGGRGLAQALGASDDLALFITGDRNLVEAVLLDR